MKKKLTTAINWNNAPEKGYVLAYFRTQALFQEFQKTDSEMRSLDERIAELLELHIFDSEREYRLMRCESGEFIETVVSDEYMAARPDAERITETVKVESGYRKMMEHLRIVNYISYNENGMLSVDNYRFAPVE